MPTSFTSAAANDIWTAALVNAIYTAINAAETAIDTINRRSDNETPTGTPNGTLTDFGLAHAPTSINKVLLFMNGAYQAPTADFTLSSSTITFIVAPPNSAVIRAYYPY